MLWSNYRSMSWESSVHQFLLDFSPFLVLNANHLPFKTRLQDLFKGLQNVVEFGDGVGTRRVSSTRKISGMIFCKFFTFYFFLICVVQLANFSFCSPQSLLIMHNVYQKSNSEVSR